MRPHPAVDETDTSVRALIARYDLHGESASLPVPIRQVARSDGWIVRYAEGLWPLYGAAVIHGLTRVMLINADVEPPFQCYAIAHEIGHALAGHAGRLQLCAGVSQRFGKWITTAQEREADRIAARLLIPPTVAYSGADAAEVAALCWVPAWLVDVFMADNRR